MRNDPRTAVGFLEGLFTRQERLALGFVLGVSLLGLAFREWQRIAPPVRPPFLLLEVRVNSASPTELSSLPGIGPILAQRIAMDRERHGRYLTLADLARVKGVTPKVLAKLKGLARFD